MIPRMPRPETELASRHLRIVQPAADTSAEVIVAVTSRVPVEPELSRCLQSVVDQEMDGIPTGVVLLLDGPADPESIAKVELPDALSRRSWVLAANCGTPSRARNTALDFIDRNLPAARWVARLDADDVLSDPLSLRSAVNLGERETATVVLGSNRVLSREGEFLRENRVSHSLLNQAFLVARTREMAQGTSENELPSCNLVFRTRSGLRYPDRRSAEDHWLVAELLFQRASEVSILQAPFFADYYLDGPATNAAHESARYHEARRDLSEAVQTWAHVYSLPGSILGLGQEGIVRCHDRIVHKHFYPGRLSAEQVDWLATALKPGGPAPAATFRYDTDSRSWIAQYPYEDTQPFDDTNSTSVREFLTRCLQHEIVCANVKRSNFRVRQNGSLLYVDIGVWIIPMHVSYLLDAATRLYSIGVLGADDEDLQRRETDQSFPPVWQQLTGFAGFYREVVAEWIHKSWTHEHSTSSRESVPASDVTLLLKACAMDAGVFNVQVTHIIDQLTQPRAFAKRVLLVDPFNGPFLRQHATGDLAKVLSEADRLQHAGLLDEIWLGPTDPDTISAVNLRWFGVETNHTHAADGVPVTPQVWAFDKIDTRFVLQVDLDVLIGRRDLAHDYLAEMMTAASPDDVLCVAFNIPFASGVKPYAAPEGEYKPEVRLGLLDLHRIRSLLPLPAELCDGRLNTTWYRALHKVQRQHGLKTVRGGNSATFYIHPPNDRKGDAAVLGRIRDLVAQGWVPDSQFGQWDLEARDEEWTYPVRSERLIIVSLGRNTTKPRLQRFAQGLACQSRRDFGVVVVDDASDSGAPSDLVHALGWLGDRLTLIRNPTHRNRVANYRYAISEICQNPESMILIVDLDDALSHPAAVDDVVRASDAGHDVVWAASFRPDAPLRFYSPDPDRIQQSYGGDVWTHMRAFRKSLFDGLSPSHLEVDGSPLDDLVDYAMMVPIATRARAPLFMPRYRYWHERTTVLDAAEEDERDRMILCVLAKNTDGVEG